MEFRRSGQLDERRRRVLMDELAQPADSETADAAPTGGGSAKGPVRAYSAAVLNEHQPQVTDLLPTSPWWTAAAILLALTVVAAIECIHIHIRTLPLPAGETRLAALDAMHRGGLDDWFSSLLLAGGALLALLAFGIRRHRVDDYRGRYRVWLWAAGALAWASLDSATHIHNSLGLALSYLAGRPLVNGSHDAACTISWLAVYGLVFGTLAIRMAIEIGNSLPALAALLLAGLCYLLCGMGALDMLPHASPLVDSVLHTTLPLLAHVGAVSAVILYARHVCLDATGRLKVHIDPDKNRRTNKKLKAKLKVVNKDDSQFKKAQPSPSENKPAAAAAEKPAGGGPLRFAMSGGSQPVKASASISKAAATSASYDEDDDEDQDDEGDEKLSRSERRRLKKLARREGQRRAA